MSKMAWVSTVMRDVTDNGIPDAATRENILCILNMLLGCTGDYKQGEVQKVLDLLELVLNTKVKSTALTGSI